MLYHITWVVLMFTAKPNVALPGSMVSTSDLLRYYQQGSDMPDRPPLSPVGPHPPWESPDAHGCIKRSSRKDHVDILGLPSCKLSLVMR